MSTILFVEDTAICREPIAAMLRLKGFTVVCAADGLEAMKLLDGDPADLVLLDVAMPRVDGLTLLRVMRSRPGWRQTPVILLTAVMERDYVVHARELGANEYMLKSHFSFDQLLARVRKHTQSGAADAAPAAGSAGGAPQGEARQAAPAPAPSPAAGVRAAAEAKVPQAQQRPANRLTRQETLDRIAKLAGVKTVAGVVTEIIAMAASSRTAVTDIVGVIKRDPAIASRVLHAANSAALATNKTRITTIEEAARNVGMVAIRNIAAAVGVFDTVASGSAGSHEMMRCWQHSFAVAEIMNRLAAATSLPNASIASLVGLCHDLPEIVLRLNAPAEFAAAAALAQEHPRSGDAFGAVFGMSRADITAATLTRLGLPPAIREPVVELFEHERAPGTEASPLARLLHYANDLAHGLMLASTPAATVAPIALAQANAIFTGKLPLIDAAAVRGEVITLSNALARLNPDEQQVLTKPFFPQRPLPVWYARHATLAQLDPVAVLLGMLCEPQIKDRLPSAAELRSVAGLVVCTAKNDQEPFRDAAIRALTAENPDVPVVCLALSAPQDWAAGVPAPVSIDAMAAFAAKLKQQPAAARGAAA